MNEWRMYHASNYPPLKAQKATQACNQCRKRRRRCEGGQPCFGCLENSTECVFDDNDRPSESFRRALRHAQQHANKVQALSQRLDQVTEQLNAMVKRNERTVLASTDSTNLQSERHLGGEQSRTTMECSIDKWPEVCAMLSKARIPEEAVYMTESNFNASPVANSSLFDSTSSPRKRKRKRKCSTHLHCALYGRVSIPNEGDYISRIRADVLVQSYVQNIHNFYPIIDLAQVTGVLNRLADQGHLYSSTIQLHHTRTCLKNVNLPAPTSSVPHALLYLILALGEVCERRRSSGSSVEPTSRGTEQLNCEPHSPVSAIVENALHAASRQGSSIGVADPGLPLYERATRIMGQSLDGNGLTHAQVAVLAGLYKSLVGRPIESLNWICTAGRTIEHLLRRWNIVGRPLVPQESRQRRNDNPHYLQNKHISDTRRLILLNAWTCIQLEHDMQCPTKLPQSGLLRYENILPLPYHVHNRPIAVEGKFRKQASQHEWSYGDNIVMMYYTTRLTLMKEIHQIQQHYLYEQCLQLSPEQLCRTLREDRKTLEDWRFNLPSVLRWSDDSPPSDDVLSTKLRMQYYNGLVNVYRPYLDYALHIRPYCTTMRDVHTLAVDSDGNVRSKAETYVFQVLARMPDCEIRDAISCCLRAAFRSVRTFLSTARKPLLLEFHGVASAQYKNLLMLCAAYMAQPTRPMIRSDDLVDLISSSVAFFKGQDLMTEWCLNNAMILQRMLAIILDAGW